VVRVAHEDTHSKWASSSSNIQSRPISTSALALPRRRIQSRRDQHLGAGLLERELDVVLTRLLLARRRRERREDTEHGEAALQEVSDDSTHRAGARMVGDEQNSECAAQRLRFVAVGEIAAPDGWQFDLHLLRDTPVISLLRIDASGVTRAE
jgi:hypothetical protein